MSDDDSNKRAQTTVPDVVLFAAEGDPLRDELAERLWRQTTVRIKESRRLIDAAKQALRDARKLVR